jgi:hypothetical protein
MKLRVAKKILKNTEEKGQLSHHAEQIAKATNRVKRYTKNAKA